MKTEWERDDRSLQRVSATALHQQQQQLIFKLTPTQKEPAQLSSVGVLEPGFFGFSRGRLLNRPQGVKSNLNKIEASIQ